LRKLITRSAALISEEVVMTPRVYGSAALVCGSAALATLLFSLAAPGADEPAKRDTGRIRASDRLYLHVATEQGGEPIKGVYRVEPSGKVPLGFYGRVQVAGLTPEDAEVKVREHLEKLENGPFRPRVSLTWYDPVVHGKPALHDRVARLEKEVGELRDAVEKLRKR